uniref:Uncharacterized protein n=1 Tax=Oryza brachyantha TaxID=4533 RepID=J3ME32_ORYBR
MPRCCLNCFVATRTRSNKWKVTCKESNGRRENMIEFFLRYWRSIITTNPCLSTLHKCFAPSFGHDVQKTLSSAEILFHFGS